MNHVHKFINHTPNFHKLSPNFINILQNHAIIQITQEVR